jgi:hypothetical protein
MTASRTCPLSQLEVARLFSALPASRGFLLAGGAAFSRSTSQRGPLKTSTSLLPPSVDRCQLSRDALEAAAREQGWNAQRIHDSETFCRMVVRSADTEILVDLAVNAPPGLPASATPAGPTLAPEELVGHKLLALFDRAAARDFSDVYVLAIGSAKTSCSHGPSRSTWASTPTGPPA